MRRAIVFVGLIGLTAASQLAGARPPDEYQRVASDVVKVHELARVIEPEGGTPATRQRITIVGRVVETVRTSRSRADGEVIVIDYTVDLAARAAEQKAFDEKNAERANDIFVYEPDAPVLDSNHEFWAHVAPAGGRLANVNRFAGRVIEFRSEIFSGPVFVPVAGQYSWGVPDRGTAYGAPADAKSTTEQTFTGRLKTGIMAIGGESTGVILETASGVFELDVRSNPRAREQLATLDGKQVTVTGEYRPRPGVEVKERRIVIVHTLEAAN
jgi:hypothetical protein